MTPIFAQLLLADIDATAVATWVIGTVTVVTMIVLAALGSYMGSVRSVNRIEVAVAELYAKLQKEMMLELSAMRSDISKIAATAEGMARWVTELSHGNSPHIAQIREQLSQHEATIDDHGHRLTKIEIEHAQQMGRGGCGKQ